jgi:alpha-glucosidase
MKDPGVRDNPPNPGYQLGRPEIERLLQVYSTDQPDVHDVIAGMRRVLEEYDDRVLIGEIYLPIERLVTYYGVDLSGAHLPFNFQLIQTAWNAREISTLVNEYEQALPAGGWPNWVLGNHDQPRIAARVGAAQARVAAMLLLSLRGTPTMYYGDELGLGRVTIPPEAMRDPWERNEPGLGLSRDPSRTPFQWDASLQAGFTRGEPWLPLAPDWPARNADALGRDPTSILALYRRLIALRRRHRALGIGAFRLTTVADQVLVYERSLGRERIVVALNFGSEAHGVAVPLAGAVLVSTHLDRTGAISELTLRGDEGVIVLCDAAEEDDGASDLAAQP